LRTEYNTIFGNTYENYEVGKQWGTEITYRLFVREYTFVKYYLSRIARRSLIISPADRSVQK